MNAVKTYHDIAGDGGSDVLGQVSARQRAVAEALAGVRHVLAVGSGKGGVGKSTVTMALARAFRRTGLRVAILDADLNGPTQARLAGLEGAPWIPIEATADLDGQSGLALPRRPDGIGVASLGSLLPEDRPLAFETVSKGEQQTWRATRELALLLQLLSSVRWGELDLLLVDLPPGAERTVQYAELLAPLVQARAEEDPPAGPDRLAFLMVTVPSDVSRGVVARSLAALAETPARHSTQLLGYVENMAGYFCRECGEVRPLFPEPTVPLDAPCLGRLPFDPALAELCDRGWPEGSEVEADSEAFRQVEHIARRIQEALKRPVSAPAGAGGGHDVQSHHHREGASPSPQTTARPAAVPVGRGSRG